MSEPSDRDRERKEPDNDDDIEFGVARAVVVGALGLSVALTPLALVCLSYHAAYNHIVWVVDDRIIIACLAAWTVIIAYAFKRSWKI